MRKSFVALLLLAGAATCLVATTFASEIEGTFNQEVMNARLMKMQTLAAKQGVSAAGDTIWVGYNPAFAGSNYWSIGPGTNRPTGAPPTSATGVWDFDHPVHGDSLQGCWPYRFQFTSATATVPDEQRPWHAVEFGNTGNYVINQGAAYKRTFGVTGYWHRDPGNTVNPPNYVALGLPAGGGVGWAPLNGAGSAWCGLRQHHDDTVVDPITGNSYNETTVMYCLTNGIGTGSGKTYPGYGNQWDQMLYKDVDITSAAGSITLTFKLATAMSTGKNTAALTRCGWYEGDPLTINVPTPGNFISAEAGSPANAAAPIDSFQVYVGKPCEGTFTGSDNNTHTIYDPLRRWFNEVLDKNQRLWVYGTFGNNAAATQTVTISAANVTALKAGGNNTLRVVFRVHTNASSSDDSGPSSYCSAGQGAAVIDDVTLDQGAGAVTIGDFDAAGSIDNTALPTAAWHSTGKPPAVYHHVHNLSSLAWNDVCGPVTSPIRLCNMVGNVIAMGNHDAGEESMGPIGTLNENGFDGIFSPTIGLVGGTSSTPNSFGLTLTQATPTQGYFVYFDIYTAIFTPTLYGCWWQEGCQCYPALQLSGGGAPAPGTPQWAEPRAGSSIYSDGIPECGFVRYNLTSNGLILSANGANARPDSIRIYFRKYQACYRTGAPNCDATVGGYLDNLSLEMINGSPAALSVSIWDWFQDTFSANETAGLTTSPNFDTTSALIRIGRNTATQSGTITGTFDVPGDSVTVNASEVPGEQVRVDMVFRIKPGVGNYVTVGNPSSGLRRVPTSTTPVVSGDGSFWGQFEGTPGDFATPSATALDAGWPGGWNWNVWRSARCDTAQGGLFPVSFRSYGDYGSNNGQLPATVWMSCYHESDPHYSTLGLSRHKCFMVDTGGALVAANITCSSVPAWLLDGVYGPRAGYDGNVNTIEGTQIIPDGQLTPGAHVEYFFAKRILSNLTSFDMIPDTTQVYLQNAEGSYDGHRWQEFSVLPDRWKDGAFGGQGMACALYIDWNDRRGDELVWVGLCDSIGATSAAKRGAHNGWSGPGDVDVNDPAYFVAAHGGQPGTTWDMYGIKAAESAATSGGSIGSRLAFRDVGNPLNLVDGKYAKNAPTPEMMSTFYKLALVLTGDLNASIFGPFKDKSADDLGFLQTWLAGGSLAAPRGILMSGDGWCESLAPNSFLTDVLGCDLVDGYYLGYTGDATPVLDLKVSTDISPAGDIYGVRNSCTFTDDILTTNSLLPEVSVAGEYPPQGVTHFVAGTLKKANATRPWIALTNGYDIVNATGRFDVSDKGRLAYFFNALKNVFGGFCNVQGAPATTLDTPNNATYLNFVKLGTNPVTNRQAKVIFSLAKQDRVQIVVFDVSGRKVRTLADRVFQAGISNLTWDGVDDHGTLVPRGVYFARTSFAGQNFTSANKMIILN